MRSWCMRNTKFGDSIVLLSFLGYRTYAVAAISLSRGETPRRNATTQAWKLGVTVDVWEMFVDDHDERYLPMHAQLHV